MDDLTHMRTALHAAAQGVVADPNPRVGAVLTDPAGTVVAVGYHRGAGSAHAEVDALTQAAGRAHGGTAYVTLEPCHHTGRTGPCTQALLDAGITRVVYAQSDPNPQASGGGTWLAAAGIQVTSGLLADAAEQLNDIWTAAMRLGRPFVTWKYAATLDGRSAAADGSSQWITGPQARVDVHQRRAACGAIMVGTGTALADNPQLTVRTDIDTPNERPLTRQPWRVVVGLRELPATARLRDGSAPLLQLHTHDPQQALAELWARGIRHVWLEGGPHLAAAFLQAGCIDEVIAYVAPLLLGAGPTAASNLGISTLADAHRLQLHDVTRCGDDVRLTYRTVR
ncbi:bifunctional diaminohydroxyphosphoribosylaminopyrimidine deaminase/5-amino-6-(5-phosphoribosylamino)uracil reductase RibD [Austwickia sp. TVS 96-490-7B]|uniref:bifunctional diaminohydroxyphosphoribosylaminopyrimidine deaminase/5-amino-6-(5-phosphoribosylamino)uracil reductase RibD n=1 Tax=Austwickia sp. TVS 96-490-7B TaxID=2830843 RepID=UPI001C56944D|nr:bifunctional diaminohydroxyphosphoribosylaminopyrimidine deaminase/5-amino-6-(5-phosphoribosylamino)uracil reductase RibD [Austwickia sp. TVS 96-490-7B]